MSANFIPDKEDYKILTPFKMQVLTNFPYIEADFDALTNYQLLCKIVEYLNNVIHNENELTEQVNSLYNAYVSLQNYVNTYFDNLDLQTEVDRKLDEMAEDGTLADMIAEYIKMQGQLVYNSVAEMKEAENIQNGSFLKTYGYYEYNDGGGAYYKARTVTNEDVINDKTIIALHDNTLVAELILDDVINIKQLGAKGDNETDETELFNFAQTLGRSLYVPAGNYILNNFDFNNSIEWTFKRSSSHPWFEGDDKATIYTSTGLSISKGPKINNLIIKYNGNISDISQRPVGLKLNSHFCEIHGLHVSYFNVGIGAGLLSNGNCDYTKLYDIYSWYNYYCGLYLHGDATHQINFLSIYDCNIGSNGVDPHDNTKIPDTSRGYGVYLGLCNDIHISNGDFSSNETCSFYIDNNNSTKTTRGLHVCNAYAEANKYCDIFYNNGANSTNTRTQNVIFDSCYFYHTETNQYYVGELHLENTFVPPSVKILDYPKIELKEKTCVLYDYIKYGGSSHFVNNIDDLEIILKKNTKYKITMKIRGKSTGNLTCQNEFRSSHIISASTPGTAWYNIGGRISLAPNVNIPLVTDQITTYDLYLETPDTSLPLLTYDILSYGADGELVDLAIEEIPFTSSNTMNTPQAGAIRLNGTTAEIYLDGAWKTITTS